METQQSLELIACACQILGGSYLKDGMKRKPQPEIFVLTIATSEGEFRATYSGKGLCGLEFPSNARPVEKPQTDQLPAPIRGWHSVTSKALSALLAGRQPADLPPLDLSSGTHFQQSVWRALCQIGCGQTLSYGGVAEAIRKPKAVRAVGQACGANPIPVFIPCHRVLAAHDRLGGFSGGLKWKRLLLQREGAWTEQMNLEQRHKNP